MECFAACCPDDPSNCESVMSARAGGRRRGGQRRGGGSVPLWIGAAERRGEEGRAGEGEECLLR